MELFKITCVTCQAGLSVRSKALIGQIVACPRCNSMVEVTPPAQSAAPVAPVVTTTSEPSESLPTAQPPQVTGEMAAAEDAVLAAAKAEALQASAAVAKYKLMVWSLASFFVGAIVVGAVLLTRGDSSAEVTAITPGEIASSKTETTDAELPTDSTRAVSDLPEQEAPVTEAPTEAVLPPVTEKTSGQPTVEPAQMTPTAEPQQSVEAVVTPPEPAPRTARRFDPLNFDPENLTLATLGQTSDPAVVVANDPPVEELSVERPEEVPSTTPLVRFGPVEGEAVSGRNAEKQLAIVIPALKIEQLPLVDCLRLLSQLSGVPVSVAPEQLLMAGITPLKKVSLDARDTSLEEMLNQVLEPLRLEFVAQGAQVVVIRREATKTRAMNYPIDDLVDSGTSEQQLADWVEQLVAPATWQARGGQGTLAATAGSLRITQTQQVQYQVLIMLERLRLAKSLPPRSHYPVERLAGPPAHGLLHQKLTRSATFTFSHYTALDDVFVHWQTELGVPLLIDWPALAEADLWPETTIACAIHDQPWNVALEKILEPLGLGWRAATGGAIEITSAEKVQHELQLEIYALRTGAKISAELLDELHSLAKPATAQSSLKYDSTGNALLVLQPAAIQRAVWQHLQKLGLLGE